MGCLGQCRYQPEARTFRSAVGGVAGGPLLAGLVIVSWFLVGNAVWGYAAASTAMILILLTLSGFKLLDELRSRHFLLYAYLVLCWASWTAVGAWTAVGDGCL